jgi:hypothetical protein
MKMAANMNFDDLSEDFDSREEAEEYLLALGYRQRGVNWQCGQERASINPRRDQPHKTSPVRRCYMVCFWRAKYVDRNLRLVSSR